MLEKAKILAARFDQLTDQLSDPEVLSDNSAMARIGKERARLEPVAKLAREIEAMYTRTPQFIYKVRMEELERE